jgi:exopolysaccharide production protein ExoY
MATSPEPLTLVLSPSDAPAGAGPLASSTSPRCNLGFSLRNMIPLTARTGGDFVNAPDARARCVAKGPIGGLTKRSFDLIFATAALLLLIPSILFIAILVKATLGGPVFFRHRRIGQSGIEFDCYKFRTMVSDSGEVLARHLRASPEAREQWAATRKLTRDPRVTKLGRILRKSSLDEIPQLINIVRGEMSFVGPRPIVSEELGRYGAAVEDYLAARPGLTGLWQVSGRSKVSYEQRVAFDSAYVRNWSVSLDLLIVLKTIPAVLHHEETS